MEYNVRDALDFSACLSICMVRVLMDVTIIGHGSLMSGRGLSFSGTLHVREAFIVALAHCQRGFAKLSRYGLSGSISNSLGSSLEICAEQIPSYG